MVTDEVNTALASMTNGVFVSFGDTLILGTLR
jgi:hypothetical protein